MICGVEGCARTYRNFRSFQKHLNKRHQAALDTDDDGGDSALTFQTTQEARDESNSDTHIDVATLKRSAGLFLLKTKEINRVTQVALNDIVEGVSELFQAHESAGNVSCTKPFVG